MCDYCQNEPDEDAEDCNGGVFAPILGILAMIGLVMVLALMLKSIP